MRRKKHPVPWHWSWFLKLSSNDPQSWRWWKAGGRVPSRQRGHPLTSWAQHLQGRGYICLVDDIHHNYYQGRNIIYITECHSGRRLRKGIFASRLKSQWLHYQHYHHYHHYCFIITIIIYSYLIIVSHTSHGVSVKIFKWGEFSILNAEGPLCNFTHSL